MLFLLINKRNTTVSKYCQVQNYHNNKPHSTLQSRQDSLSRLWTTRGRRSFNTVESQQQTQQLQSF